MAVVVDVVAVGEAPKTRPLLAAEGQGCVRTLDVVAVGDNAVVAAVAAAASATAIGLAADIAAVVVGPTSDALVALDIAAAAADIGATGVAAPAPVAPG